MTRTSSLLTALALTTLAACAQTLPPLAPPGPAAAPPGWLRLQHLEPGTSIVVDTGLYPIGPQAGERCRVLAIDAATLACQAPGRHGARLVFPAASVGSVYRVHHAMSLSAFFTIAGTGLLIGGLIASNGGAVLLGVIVDLIVLATAAGQGLNHLTLGGAAPPAGGVRYDLLYLRPPPVPPAYFPPTPAPATPFAASIP